MKGILPIVILLMVSFLWSDRPAAAEPVEDELSVVVHKKSHILQVYVNETAVITFPVATGKGELTPEGQFTIAKKS